MTSSEKFCLRWNDFESNISVAFREIREEKDFFDCTISCGARQIQAHKLILSACSPFFRTILKQNPHQHPLLYLKGVEFNDLQAVLNFMYHGEVNVAQEELNSFLSVAEDLKVKGLTQNNSENSTTEKPKQEPIPSHQPQVHQPQQRPRPTIREDQTPKRPRYQAPLAPSQYQEDDIQEVMPVVKQEPPTPSPMADYPPPAAQPMPVLPQAPYQPSMVQVQGHTVAQVEEGYGEDGYDYGGYEEGYEEMDHSAEGMEPNKVFSGVEDVKSFIQSSSNQLESGEWLCCLCQKVVRNKGNLVQHMEVNHLDRVARYPCPQCGEKFVTRRKLARHKKSECQAAV